MIENRKQYNYDLLLLKYLMSCLIIGIHCFTVSKVANIFEFALFQGIARLAVPCFFTISAYLFYKKTNGARDKNRLHKYYIRLLKLMAIWGVFLSPYILYFSIYVPIRDSKNISIAILRLVVKSLIGMQINGFWYLYASIICVVIFYAFDAKKHFKLMLLFSVLAQFVCIAFSCYYNLLSPNISNIATFLNDNIICCYNSFLVACIYFCIGLYIASNQKENLFLYKHRLQALLVCTVLFCIEIIYVYKLHLFITTDCYIMLAPTIYFLVLNVLDTHIKAIKHSKYLSAATTVQYLSQFAIIFILQGAAKRIEWYNIPPIIMFTGTFLISNALTWVLLYIEKKYKLTLIKNMY